MSIGKSKINKKATFLLKNNSANEKIWQETGKE